MSANILYFGFGLIQLGLAITAAQRLKRPLNRYSQLVLVVVLALAHDNLAIAVGSLLGEGSLLKALNWLRYALHALFTPTMIISSFGAMRLAGINFAQSHAWHMTICLIATALILLGSYIDIIQLDLVAETTNGVTRYLNDFVLMPGPPIPAVLTIVFALIFGLILWRATNWSWLFVGSLLMFITAPLAGLTVVQNLGEIAFAAGLLSTMIHVESDIGD